MTPIPPCEFPPAKIGTLSSGVTVSSSIVSHSRSRARDRGPALDAAGLLERLARREGKDDRRKDERKETHGRNAHDAETGRESPLEAGEPGPKARERRPPGPRPKP